MAARFIMSFALHKNHRLRWSPEKSFGGERRVHVQSVFMAQSRSARGGRLTPHIMYLYMIISLLFQPIPIKSEHKRYKMIIFSFFPEPFC